MEGFWGVPGAPCGVLELSLIWGVPGASLGGPRGLLVYPRTSWGLSGVLGRLGGVVGPLRRLGGVLVRLGRQSRAKRGLGQGLWEELREILGNLRRGPPQRIWEKGIFELITSPKRLTQPREGSGLANE